MKKTCILIITIVMFLALTQPLVYADKNDDFCEENMECYFLPQAYDIGIFSDYFGIVGSPIENFPLNNMTVEEFYKEKVDYDKDENIIFPR